VFIWGINPAVSKLGLAEIPPFAFLTIRYIIIALLCLPFARPTKTELKQLFIVAITSNVINNILGYIAYDKLSPSACSLLLQTEAPISILMACIWAQERVNLKQIMAILLSFIGVVIMVGLSHMQMTGVVLILLSRVFWGACQIIFKDTKHMSIPVFLGYSYLFAVPFTFVGSLWFEHYDYRALLSVDWAIMSVVMFFEVVVLSVAFVLWQKLIAANGINKISPFITLRIVFGIAAGVLIFHDALTWQIIAGSILVTIGVFLTMREFHLITKARSRTILIYRNAHRMFMERKLQRSSLRKIHH
jgi:O-acetylserine/cysteine efflux transporter